MGLKEASIVAWQNLSEEEKNAINQTLALDNYTQTDSPDFVITIALNNNANEHGVNYRPNLMIAKTIAHEVIHAEMYRKLLSLANQVCTNRKKRNRIPSF